MSLDQHIRQLSETIIGELRAPIEASLRRLLEEVVTSAARDRDEAITHAVAAATAPHQAALEDLRAQAEHQLQQSLDAVSAASEMEAQEALDSLRSAAEREKQQALAALEAELTRSHEAALASLREEAAADRATAVATATALARQEAEQQHHQIASVAANREAEVQLALEQAAAERETAVQAALEQAAADREAALQLARDEAAREREAAVQLALEQAAADRAAALQLARDEAARDREAAVQLALEQAAVEHEAALQLTRDEAARDRDAAMLFAQDEAAREREAALASQRDQEHAAHADAVRDAQASERRAGLACTGRLAEGFRRLDAGRTLTDVLGALADHVAAEAGRSAVFLVNGARLRGWRFANFSNLQPADVDLPLDAAGLLGASVTTGMPVATSEQNGGAAALPAVLQTPGDRVGLAVPLLVGQRVVAVLYADDAAVEAPAAPSSWPEIAEVLARHAARCLEVLTLARFSTPQAAAAPSPYSPRAEAPAEARVPESGSQADGPDSDAARQAESARRYARLLLSEVKLYNESAVDEGRRERDLLARLGPEVERARRLYEEKIPAAVRERADWFEQELVRTLAGGDAALLGQVT